jgi:ABC-type Fe3+/spermidine/putrescine transport system ATPase subunit
MFGGTRAVDCVSLTVQAGEALVLLGPSGCGKTTTLRLIAGFERPDAGRIALGDRTLVDGSIFVQPERREMAVVFQSYALWPHMTVDQNVGFGPQLRSGRRSVAAEVDAALAMVRLRELGHRYPHELSGGQQQRVALARALVTRPEVLLLDEPLSNLDTQLREEMRFEIKRLQRDLDQTMIYVTHDQSEALSLADRVAVLKDGCIEQLGTPEELYAQPRTSFVARALGPTNVFDARVIAVNGRHCQVEVGDGTCTEVANVGERSLGATVQVSVRPAAMEIARPGPGCPGIGQITEALFLGDVVQYVVKVDRRDEPVRVVGSGPVAYGLGDRVEMTIRSGAAAMVEG